MFSVVLSIAAAHFPPLNESDKDAKIMIGVAAILCVAGWFCWFKGV